MIKVLIVDDQKLLAEGLKSVLQTDEELSVVGIALDGLEGLNKCEELSPDVVLMDVRMPNMNGVVATDAIKSKFPEIKVIILTTFDDSDYILNAINNGANGYLLKDTNAVSLINAIKSAYNGDTILPTSIAKKIASAATMVSNDREIKLKKAFSFSDREIEIALMIYEGFTNKQISSALKLSDGTARNYISSIYLKIGCENRNEAIEKMKQLL